MLQRTLVRLVTFMAGLFLLTPVLSAGEGVSWERPVIIGASLSDGFDLKDMGLPFVSSHSKKLGLHHHLKASLTVTHGPILNLGSNWTFLATEPSGNYQIKKARAADPTVVLAIDYLFWYLSTEPKQRGRGFREMSRLQFFEVGLAHLATLQCPVVVGNIPDAQSSIGKVLSPQQYAGKEIITKANARLAQWVKERPQVMLLDLHHFHQQASANQEMKVLGETIPAGEARERYLQRDQLHPTLTGATTIAKVALQLLAKSAKD